MYRPLNDPKIALVQAQKITLLRQIFVTKPAPVYDFITAPPQEVVSFGRS